LRNAGGARSGLRVLRRLFQSALFYVLLLHLGAMSLTWNLVSLMLYPFL